MVLAKYNHFFDFLTFDKGLKTHSNPIRTGQRVVIVAGFPLMLPGVQQGIPFQNWVVIGSKQVFWGFKTSRLSG